MRFEFLKALLDLIPFKEERLEDLTMESDLVGFCGEFQSYRWSSRGPNDYELVLDDFRSSCADFFASKPSIDAAEQADRALLKVLKHRFAFDELIGHSGGRDQLRLNGLPFLYETRHDLDGVLRLGLWGHTRQANAALRGALETSVAHYYYSSQGLFYDSLIGDENFRSPSFRAGKNSMIAALLSNGYIDLPLFETLSRCYGNLNPFVHGHIKCLTIEFYEGGSNPDETNLLWQQNFCDVTACLIRLVFSMMEKRIDYP